MEVDNLLDQMEFRKVVQIFGSVDKILRWLYSNGSTLVTFGASTKCPSYRESKKRSEER